MRNRAYDALHRLQRQAVDEERRTLAAAQREVTRLEAARDDLRATRRAEVDRPGAPPDLLGRYLERMRHLEAALATALDEAVRAREARAARLRGARLRMRQIERLGELREQRAAVEAGRRDRRLQDDLTLIRRAGGAMDEP